MGNNNLPFTSEKGDGARSRTGVGFGAVPARIVDEENSAGKGIDFEGAVLLGNLDREVLRLREVDGAVAAAEGVLAFLVGGEVKTQAPGTVLKRRCEVAVSRVGRGSLGVTVCRCQDEGGGERGSVVDG